MITVAIQRSPTYLRAVASGTADLAENCSAVVFVADVLRRTSSTRLLFDMRALRPGFGKADVLQVISTLYSSLPAMDKIAVVVAPGTSQGIVLEVARHRNVAAEEFSSTQEAEEWLQL